MSARACLPLYLPVVLGLLWYTPAAGACARWPDWEIFARNFISADGRVVDHAHADMRTVSEAQAYALFFALIANDKPRFRQLLTWTENNLARGDLSTRLPAWLWGRNAEGDWGVLDDNAAADADLWLAYTLIQAGRLWEMPSWQALGTLLGRQIIRRETHELPGLGLSLLPGPSGFIKDETTRFRLNPSYSPLFLLRALATHDPLPAWQALIDSSLQTQRVGEGFVPDWVEYREDKGLRPVLREGHFGGHDAIRVYLWAGLLHADEPARAPLLNTLAPMARWVAAQGYPPVRWPVDSDTRPGPGSFSWAMLPMLQALGMDEAADEQRLRVIARPVPEDAYYGQALKLFAAGWLQGRYRFDPQGMLELAWPDNCP